MKVFEFAKEIGMETLALMDKIREWKLPVRSHMADLDSEMLEEIRTKLRGDSEAQDSTAKKATTRIVVDCVDVRWNRYWCVVGAIRFTRDVFFGCMATLRWITLYLRTVSNATMDD